MGIWYRSTSNIWSRYGSKFCFVYFHVPIATFSMGLTRPYSGWVSAGLVFSSDDPSHFQLGSKWAKSRWRFDVSSQWLARNLPALCKSNHLFAHHWSACGLNYVQILAFLLCAWLFCLWLFKVYNTCNLSKITVFITCGVESLLLFPSLCDTVMLSPGALEVWTGCCPYGQPAETFRNGKK